MAARAGAIGIDELQRRYELEEFRSAVRALLSRPLLGTQHEDFSAVRRQADRVREWFARETGWIVHIERDIARLYKRPADLADATRGLPGYNGCRYVLLCLACAVLERADPQITLRVLGERLLQFAAEPTLAERGFSFTLQTATERRDLVAVCRTLLEFCVLRRIAGDEEGFVHGEGPQGDALYDVQRRPLAGILAAVRGPSTWRTDDAPRGLEERIRALSAEHAPDTEEGRRTALRHNLARRLLDDPVVYTNSLDPEAQSYFANQRGPMAARLCEATGLASEQRAEGLALTDESGTLTDVALPSEGTDAHATLLVAEFLARAIRDPSDGDRLTANDVVAFLREAVEHYGRYWRKSAREPGGERELAELALNRLEKLQLVMRDGDAIRPRPALARFSLGVPDLRGKGLRSSALGL